MNGWREWRDAVPSTYGVLGDPIHHSLSPKMHTALYEHLGLEFTYHAIRVPLEEFEQAIDHLTKLGLRGVNVTVPLKEAAFSWAQKHAKLETSAKLINTLDLVNRRATNTDIAALLKMLREFSAKKRILVLGAGGTASSLLKPLLEAGYQVSLWNRTLERAVSAIGDLPVPIAAQPIAETFEIVLNTTSASLSGEAPPVDWSGATCDAFDVSYAASGFTPFLAQAQAAGLRVADGRGMLVEQGALAFEWWTGKNAERSVMMKAIQCP